MELFIVTAGSDRPDNRVKVTTLVNGSVMIDVEVSARSVRSDVVVLAGNTEIVNGDILLRVSPLGHVSGAHRVNYLMFGHKSPP